MKERKIFSGVPGTQYIIIGQSFELGVRSWLASLPACQLDRVRGGQYDSRPLFEGTRYWLVAQG